MEIQVLSAEVVAGVDVVICRYVLRGAKETTKC